ncbi:hypothetical protein E2562_018119 [Oryza meyeriana var. granulata]|uniref:Uncharacterized protein n=1 Tax=Oryza meyeriana var. granulata TaxID=110450 RepID=A0A6G1C749_9ORYZ|nr:hypothetical protein E2562_018119 [Oryza meyeriana var. granulata]
MECDSFDASTACWLAASMMPNNTSATKVSLMLIFSMQIRKSTESMAWRGRAPRGEGGVVNLPAEMLVIFA